MFRKNLMLAAISVLAIASISSAHVYYWTGESGRWDNGGGWVEMVGWTTGVPTSADEARIDSSYNPTVLIDSATTAVADGVTIGYQYNGGATLEVTGGSLTVESGRDDYWGLTVGLSKPGVLNISGGMAYCHWSNMFVGTWAAGTVNVAGGLLKVDSWLVVSDDASGGQEGKIYLDGGEIWAGNLNIGTNGLVDITSGIIKLWGNQTAAVAGFITSGKIKAFGGAGTVSNTFDGSWTVVAASIAAGIQASNPNVNGVLVLDPLAKLTWDNPQPFDEDDTILCDVYTGISPFALNKIVDKAAIDSFEINQTITGGLDYYWRVDCYDPNYNGLGSEVKIKGSLWHFVGAEDVNDGLVGYWNFEDGTSSATAADISGVEPAADATFNGSAAIVNDSIRGLVMNNTGSGSYADCDYDNIGKLFNDDAMTVSLWMKLNSNADSVGWEALVAHGDISWRLFRLSQSGYHYIIWVCQDVGIGGWDNVHLLASFPALSDLDWHHVAASYSAENGLMSIYLDGKLAATKDVSGSGRIWEQEDGVSFGALETDYPTFANYYTGQLDDIRIYTSALYSNMIETLCPPALPGSCQSGYYMPADINKDCYVDIEDIAELAIDWLGAYDYASDPSRDMSASLPDLAIVAADWQNCNDQTDGSCSFSDTCPFDLSVKTFFQTGTSWGYDSRTAIATDSVVVHSFPFEPLYTRTPWVEKGNILGSMTVMSIDNLLYYANGDWDGQDHTAELSRRSDGTIAGNSSYSYISPAASKWTEFQQEMLDKSIADGSMAIMPQEVFSLVTTGYEQPFKDKWVERYGTAWQGSGSSVYNYFLTAQLMNTLWKESVDSLADSVASNKNVGFVYANHDIYSNNCAELTAPIGQTITMDNIDGYVAQVWTGTIKWCRDAYSSTKNSFFSSALACYDYFDQLAVGTDKKTWLLVDPIEDDLSFTWSQYEDWYEDCVGAMLLLPNTATYEVMPWPERIFLNIPGITPEAGLAPMTYRQEILAVTQALQEMPLGGSWASSASTGIGVAVADTLQWEQKANTNEMQNTFGQLMPLLEEGVPVSAVVMERYQDSAYMARFDVIIVSFDEWKPLEAGMNTALASWVNAGGSLIVLGTPGDAIDSASAMWWQGLGYTSPTHHLMALVGGSVSDGDYTYGSGKVYRRAVSAGAFANNSTAESSFYPVVSSALVAAGKPALQRPGYFLMNRGSYTIAYGTDTAISSISGSFVDVFDSSLAVVTNPSVAVGQSRLLKNVSAILAGSKPAVLHTAGRLDFERYQSSVLTFKVKSPESTDSVVRLFAYNKTAGDVSAVDSDNQAVSLTITTEGNTLKVAFPGDPDGVTFTVD